MSVTNYTEMVHEAQMVDRIANAGLLALTLCGWAVVIYVIMVLPVSSGAQAVLYTAGLVALAGSAALALDLYSARAGAPVQRFGAMGYLGTGMRFALAMEFALWLQSLRMLTPAYLVFIIVGFLLIELLFRRAADGGVGQRR